jgi:hypothetical protein
VGTFAQRGLTASSLGHCASPVPITRDEAISHPLSTLGKILGYFHCGRFPKSSLIVARLVTACRCAARCRLRPQGVGFALVSNVLTAWPRPAGEDRHNPKIVGSRGYVSDSGLHPSPRRTRASPFSAFGYRCYSIERLTKPYSGGLVPPSGIPSQQATIARLPLYSSIPIVSEAS